jgi:hypothetical protein
MHPWTSITATHTTRQLWQDSQVQPWLDENQERTIGGEKYKIENLPNNEYEPDNPGTMLRINSMSAKKIARTVSVKRFALTALA